MSSRIQLSLILELIDSIEFILFQGKCTTCEGRDDITEYTHFLSALKILMFSDSDSWEISRLLAAILHLGNVKFEGQ